MADTYTIICLDLLYFATNHDTLQYSRYFKLGGHCIYNFSTCHAKDALMVTILFLRTIHICRSQLMWPLNSLDRLSAVMRSRRFCPLPVFSFRRREKAPRWSACVFQHRCVKWIKLVRQSNLRSKRNVAFKTD